MGNPLQPITVNSHICGGQAKYIRGLRFPVALVFKYHVAGRTPPQINAEVPGLEVGDDGLSQAYEPA